MAGEEEEEEEEEDGMVTHYAGSRRTSRQSDRQTNGATEWMTIVQSDSRERP